LFIHPVLHAVHTLPARNEFMSNRRWIVIPEESPNPADKLHQEYRDSPEANAV
jgi:hypothetical protein